MTLAVGTTYGHLLHDLNFSISPLRVVMTSLFVNIVTIQPVMIGSTPCALNAFYRDEETALLNAPSISTNVAIATP